MGQNNVVHDTWFYDGGQPGDAGTCNQHQWDAFARAVNALWEQGCETCGGYGHEHDKCPSRKAVDAAAKANGVSWVWGAVKGACYYD